MGAAAVGLAACGSDDGGGTSRSASPTAAAPSPSSSAAPQAVREIPDETAGPFPGDGSNGPNVLDQSGVVRSDIRTSFGGPTGRAEGVPLTVELQLLDLARGARPLSGAAVYLWHCDRQGRYSLYSEGVTQENYLRGVQVADAQGRLSFTSVFPGCYPGRWPHLHFEVYRDRASTSSSSGAIATSQVALPQDACAAAYRTDGYSQSIGALGQVSLQGDGVFGEDGGALQLPSTTGDAATGFRASLVVGVDTRTPPTGGQLSGDGRPAGVPPGGPPRR